eukprot:Sro413_g138080.2  (414) ;mRNA; r:32220-33461
MQIACRDTGGPGCAESIARRLVEMLDLNVSHICSEAATSLASVIRKHPGLKSVIAPPLSRSLKYVEESSGKGSIVYLLGECSEVTMAPYALEKLIDTYDKIDDATIKIALLSSTMKLFCQRPAEVQAMLGRLLAKATDDVSSQDLHDRALLYYRMLESGVDLPVLASVVDTKTALGQGVNFAEEDDFELRAELMKEFNTLSIVFGRESKNFIAEEFQVKFAKQPKEHPLEPGSEGAAPSAIPGGGLDVLGKTSAPAPAPAVAAAAGSFDLLGMGDPGGAAPAPAAPSGGPPFNAAVSMTGDEYQNTWGAINDSQSVVSMVPLKKIPGSTQEVETALARHGIKTMASGELPTEFKFFLYAQDSPTGLLMLIQGNLDKQSGEALLVLTVKVNGGDGGASDQQKVDTLTAVMSSAL